MIYSSWDTECDSLKLVILGHFLPFYPSKNPKIKILKKWKNSWNYQHLHVCTKKQNHTMYGSWDTE